MLPRWLTADVFAAWECQSNRAQSEVALPRRRRDDRQVPAGVITHLHVGCEHAPMLRACLQDE